MAVTAADIRRIVREEMQPLIALVGGKLAYTLAEAAAMSGYSERSLRESIGRHELVPSYANSKPVVLARELQRWLESLPHEPRRG